MSRKSWSPIQFALLRSTAAGLVASCLLLNLGCFQGEKTRGQAGDEEKERFLDIKTIRDVAELGNTLPLQVQGVGLVTGLDGTGGGPPSGELRKMMEHELSRLKVANPKQLLDSADTALVLVTGFIPPGSRRGELFDVEITLPPGSKVNSLHGGYLQECFLRLYETKSHLDPNFKGQDRVLAGHQVAKASGHLMVGLNDSSDQEANLLTGTIWEGAMSYIDRPYHFLLSDKKKLARVADAVAQRLNTMFQDDPKKRLEVMSMKGLLVLDEMTNQINTKFNQHVMSNRDTAKAISKEMVVVNVPWEYRHNTERYIRVAMFIPLLEPKDKRQEYRQRLQTLLHDPAQTLRAALRLEALGKESLPALKTCLTDPHPLVRFAGAEALAYLGDGSGVAELAKLGEKHYQLRAFCLTALATLEQSSSRTKLTELLSSQNKETRYGAFRGLQLLNVNSPEINGEMLNNSLRIHRVAPQSPGLVHYALNHRAEVILFGQTPFLVPPLAIRTGQEFNITAVGEDKLCTVSRYQKRLGKVSHKQCSLRLEEVLQTMADLGAEYPEVVELLRQVEDQKYLSCPITLNAMPQAMSVENLAKTALDPDNVWDMPWPVTYGNRPSVAPKHYQTAVSDH